MATGEKRTAVADVTSTCPDRIKLDSLLDLPPEMRLKIYDYYFALVSIKPTVEERLGPGVPRSSEKGYHGSSAFPSLMRTSPLVRYEAMPVYLLHLKATQDKLAERIAVADWRRRTSDVDMFMLEDSIARGRTSPSTAGQEMLSRLRNQIDGAIAEMKAARVTINRIEELLLELQ